MKILCVSAHPDDELLGVGATLARHVVQGDRVRAAVLCEGVSLRYNPERHEEVQGQTRAAAHILGLEQVFIGALPDQGLDTLPLTRIAAVVEQQIRDFEPEVVYTHFSGDLNRDHRAVAEAVLVATRPYSTRSVREVLMFETPSSTEWSAAQLLPRFDPQVFVDVTATLEQKLRAFACYQAEVRPPPHPRSLEALRLRAQHWGSIAGVGAAEAFSLVRAVR